MRSVVDPATVERFVAGEQKAFELIYRRYARLVFAVVRRTAGVTSDVDDIAQQVFVTAWRSKSDFDPERASLSAWLMGITRQEIAVASGATVRRTAHNDRDQRLAVGRAG